MEKAIPHYIIKSAGKTTQFTVRQTANLVPECQKRTRYFRVAKFPA